MGLTAAERALVHLHGFWNVAEPGREVTQAGIAEGARLLRSHVPRTLRALQEEGLVETRETRLRGQRRKVRMYVLTEAGVRRARELLSEIDGKTVQVDGRSTTMGEARRALKLSALTAIAATDAEGRLAPRLPDLERPSLLQRDEDLAFLRRWLVGGASVAVVYGSRGMGKTALGWTFAETVPKALWIDIAPGSDREDFAASVSSATNIRTEMPGEPESLADALTQTYARGTKLLVLDGYGEVDESIVDAISAFLRKAKTAGSKMLVLAQESTPSFCRFYGKKDIEGGRVAERHLRGLDLDGCRVMLGKADIDPEALRRIYLLTKGCPLFLRAIREGDEATLRANSRFTNAEIRLLLYSGGSVV